MFSMFCLDMKTFSLDSHLSYCMYVKQLRSWLLHCTVAVGGSSSGAVTQVSSASGW